MFTKKLCIINKFQFKLTEILWNIDLIIYLAES